MESHPLFRSGTLGKDGFQNKTDKKTAKLGRTSHAKASQKLTA